MRIALTSVQCILFGGHVVSVSGLVELERGIPVIFNGANGSGKTLTLNLLSSVLEDRARGMIRGYDAAAVRIEAASLRPAPRVAWLHQEPRDNFISRSSSDEVILPLLSAGLTRDQMAERLTSLLFETDFFGNDIFSHRISQLSGGERQRMGLLAALAGDPDYLFLDEPFARLDTISQQAVGRVIRRHCEHRYVLVAAHDVERYAETVGAEAYVEIQVENDHNRTITLHSERCVLTSGRTRVFQSIHRADLRKVERYISPDVESLEIPEHAVDFLPGSGDILFHAKLMQLSVAGKVIARSAEPRLSRGLNLCLGESGSGKTLFGSMFTGQVPINPTFPRRNQVIARQHMNGHVGSRFDTKNWWKQGLSTHLHSEPDLFLTEERVADELQQFGTLNDASSRGLLDKVGVSITDKSDELSYGQRKAVTIACLPNSLELAILDEPFSGFSCEMLEHLGALVADRLRQGHWRSCLILSNKLDQLAIAFG